MDIINGMRAVSLVHICVYLGSSESMKILNNSVSRESAFGHLQIHNKIPIVSKDFQEADKHLMTSGKQMIQSRKLHMDNIVNGTGSVIKNNTFLTNNVRLLVRHRRATNESSSSGFFDNADNLAMFVVLPILVFIYGGCMVIYCCYKCNDYIERTQPIEMIKRKIFRLPAPETLSDDESIRQESNAFDFRKHPDSKRPSSTKSMPNPKDENQFDDIRSVASTPGLHYTVCPPLPNSIPGRERTESDLSLNMRTSEDIDSGVHSAENPRSRQDDRVVYVDGTNANIKDILDNENLCVEVKHVSTVEMGTQTDDVLISSNPDRERGTKSTTPHSRNKQRGGGRIASRYLDWLKNSQELQDVIHKRFNPNLPKLSERHPARPTRPAGGVKKAFQETDSNEPQRKSKSKGSVEPVQRPGSKSSVTSRKSDQMLATVRRQSLIQARQANNSMDRIHVVGFNPTPAYSTKQKTNSKQGRLSKTTTSLSESQSKIDNSTTDNSSVKTIFHISGSPASVDVT